MTQPYGGSTAPAQRITAPGLRALKGVRKITSLTAYDAPTAALLDAAGVDMLLVGDSIEMAVYGAADTLGATLDRMVPHARAVAGAARRALVAGDMPYLSYHTTPAEAVRNAARFIVEGGCRAVKLEGGTQRLPMIEAILNAEIPVIGHIGLTPQSVNALGGFKVQGKTRSEADRLVEEAERLTDAGIFALVLECVPSELAERITKAVPVPTIGIGAGPFCDGQILVIHDLIGFHPPGTKNPKFVKRYAEVGSIVADAARAYVRDVVEGRFPSDEAKKRSERLDSSEPVTAPAQVWPQ